MQLLIEHIKSQSPNPEAILESSSWWRLRRAAPALYEKIDRLGREWVVVKAQTTKTWGFLKVPVGWIYDQALIVFVSEHNELLTILQSIIHEVWAWRYGSTLKTDLRYSPTDVFETFPFPTDLRGLETIGDQYHEHRRQIMLARHEGLTTTYNRFHKPDEQSADIARLRELHVEMDRAVAAAYGWDDINLGHGFHQTAQGIRYTISEDARREVLARLLKLNHERWEEEQLTVDSQQSPVKGKGKRKDKETGSAGDKGKKARKVKESSEGYAGRLL